MSESSAECPARHSCPHRLSAGWTRWKAVRGLKMQPHSGPAGTDMNQGCRITPSPERYHSFMDRRTFLQGAALAAAARDSRGAPASSTMVGLQIGGGSLPGEGGEA